MEEPRVWDIPKKMKNQKCFILGGGPSIYEVFAVPTELQKMVKEQLAPASMADQYMSSIHDKNVIAVNSAFRFGRWIDLVYFGDCKWLDWNKHDLFEFPGLKITSCKRWEQKAPGKDVRYVPFDTKHDSGISPAPNKVAWNKNSGAAAIDLAIKMGATKIVLIGYDMKLDDDGWSHHHGYHRERKPQEGNDRHTPPFERYKKLMPKVVGEAKKQGVEMVNVSPGTTLEVPEQCSLKEALGW